MVLDGSTIERCPTIVLLEHLFLLQGKSGKKTSLSLLRDVKITHDEKRNI